MIDPKPFYLAWQFWWQVLMLVGILANGIYSWWTNREKVNARRFSDLEKEVAQRVSDKALKEITAAREALCAKHHARTSSLELNFSSLSGSMAAMPGRAELSSLHDRVDEVHGRISAAQKELSTLNGQIGGLAHIVDLIHEWILKEGNKK